MIGHAIENMGYVFVRIVGGYEEEINKAQEFLAGSVSFTILFLIITCLPV